MARRRVEDDFTEECRKEAHLFVDTVFNMGLACIMAAKRPRGGYIWRYFGDKRSVAALTRKLNEMAEKGVL